MLNARWLYSAKSNQSDVLAGTMDEVVGSPCNSETHESRLQAVHNPSESTLLLPSRLNGRLLDSRMQIMIAATNNGLR